MTLRLSDTKMYLHIDETCIKGPLDKCNIIPQLFSKKNGIFISLEVLAWLMTAC